MNDIKISELEETKYLQGGCCFPLVQENETKKVSFETLKNELPQTEVMVGDTKTGEPGTDAKVLNTGTPTNPLLNFTIPRGDKGEQGIQGPVGPKGPKGDTGNDVYVGNKSTAPEEAVLIIEPINGTASGNSIKLTDSANDKVVKITIDGKSVQNKYTGKNLLNISDTDIAETTASGITYSYDHDTNILTLNGTATENLFINAGNLNISGTNNYYMLSVILAENTPASQGALIGVKTLKNGAQNQYIQSDKTDYSKTTTLNNKVLTNDFDKVQWFTTKGNTFNNFKCKLQITKSTNLPVGSAIDSVYEPYVGGQVSPNPDYPQNISTIENFITLKIQDNTKLLSNEVYYLFNSYDLCSIGDVKDELKHTENGIQIIQRIGAVMLTGEETITRNITYNNHYRYRVISAKDFKPAKNNASIPNIMCDKFIAIAPDNTWGSANVPKSTGISVDTNNTQGNWFISYEDESVDTLEKFKAWLKANPVLVYYELAEPVTIDIELVDLPKTYDEISNISNTKNTNMNIEYATNKSNMYYRHNGNITKMKF